MLHKETVADSTLDLIKFHAAKSLTYFNDLNTADWPVLLKEPKLTPSKMKKEIVKQRNIFLNSL